ncbi:hypothetical protein AYK21_05875 [Thermoplasmatales archaeon SG8-52-2]|jgi:hypothetical protein|nr:MAG: hypothetical protein AYK21_05875 [Thermoplasmatales archaeon SG8-52-2]
MKDKILKEVVEWYNQQKIKDEIFIEDFVDIVISKTTDFLFEEIKDGLKEEFEKGNLKHPFIISSEYYLYLKLKEIKDKVVKTTKINISNEEDILEE